MLFLMSIREHNIYIYIYIYAGVSSLLKLRENYTLFPRGLSKTSSFHVNVYLKQLKMSNTLSGRYKAKCSDPDHIWIIHLPLFLFAVAIKRPSKTCHEYWWNTAHLTFKQKSTISNIWWRTTDALGNVWINITKLLGCKQIITL